MENFWFSNMKVLIISVGLAMLFTSVSGTVDSRSHCITKECLRDICERHERKLAYNESCHGKFVEREIHVKGSSMQGWKRTRLECHFPCGTGLPDTGQGECPSWTTADNDECCTTCRSVTQLLAIPYPGKPDQYLFPVNISYGDQQVNQIQYFPSGVCGPKRHCPGECVQVTSLYPVMVADEPVTNLTQLDTTVWWYEYVEINSGCNCVNDDQLSNNGNAVWRSELLWIQILGVMLALVSLI